MATDKSEERQLACVVTLCVVSFDRLAPALNCVVAPTADAVPVTVIEPTVGEVVGEGLLGVEARRPDDRAFRTQQDFQPGQITRTKNIVVSRFSNLRGGWPLVEARSENRRVG